MMLTAIAPTLQFLGPNLEMPDSSGLTPLSFPSPPLQGYTSQPPSAKPTPETIRKFENAMAKADPSLDISVAAVAQEIVRAPGLEPPARPGTIPPSPESSISMVAQKSVREPGLEPPARPGTIPTSHESSISMVAQKIAREPRGLEPPARPGTIPPSPESSISTVAREIVREPGLEPPARPGTIPPSPESSISTVTREIVREPGLEPPARPGTIPTSPESSISAMAREIVREPGLEPPARPGTIPPSPESSISTVTREIVREPGLEPPARPQIVPVSPEDVDKLAPVRKFTAKDGTVIPYREYIPASIGTPAPADEPELERSVSYPLVLFMHGAGTRGDDGAAFTGNIAFKCILSQILHETPAIVLAPQCPVDAKWVDTQWEETTHVYSPVPSRHMEAALELFDREIQALPVDQSRILVCGNSMGGYATWDILSRRPDTFAAALPVCGGGTPEKVVEASRTTPIWTVHGGADDVVPVENTRALAEAVRVDPAHKAEFRYSELPGVKHDCWTATFSDPEVMDWFFSKRRPDHAEPAATAVVPGEFAGETPASTLAAQNADSAGAAARTAAIVQTANAITDAIVAQIAATPALVRGGDAELRITLKTNVLDGSEILVSSKEGTLSVAITPTSAAAAQTISAALPNLEQALAAHAPAFHHVTVSVSPSKKEKTHETA